VTRCPRRREERVRRGRRKAAGGPPRPACRGRLGCRRAGCGLRAPPRAPRAALRAGPPPGCGSWRGLHRASPARAPPRPRPRAAGPAGCAPCRCSCGLRRGRRGGGAWGERCSCGAEGCASCSGAACLLHDTAGRGAAPPAPLLPAENPALPPSARAAHAPSCRASSRESSSTRLARGVKGISTATKPEPRPMIFSTSVRASLRFTPMDLSTLAAMPVDSPIRPSRICSVPTKLWPRRRASSCASMTTLIAFSVKRSNMALTAMRPRPGARRAAPPKGWGEWGERAGTRR
jgi:hypothetical protein